MGLELDTRRIKIGTGVTRWNDLPYSLKQIDNILLNGNSIASSNTDGNIELVPNGAGKVAVQSDLFIVGAVTMTQNNASTNISSGTLVVTGGVGVSGQITTQNLSVVDQFNTGVSLATNSWPTGELIVRSKIVDLKNVAETNLFTVPTGYMFLVDSMEIVTTSITGASTAPSVRFGTSTLPDDYYAATQIASNSVGARHIIYNPQDAALAGSVISFGVTAGSTASTHYGCAIVKGYLFKTS